ncbi:MAG: hypothetical protein CVU95_14885 [Firmicutes bacterium HGW-Firmicutes-2]|nr:MAG: hypothetical protein CVU95_14885 [Firmicutes bacterium HGW-Firmicutes-2]
MDRIYQAQAANQVRNVQIFKEKVNASEVQQSFENVKTMGGPFLDGGKKSHQQLAYLSKADRPLQLSNKLVPSEQRLSTLADVFDDKTLKRMGAVECATCASRTYQDKSDDASVSFQTPTHLSPTQAASAVISHEMEHVSNEQADAKEEGKEIIAQSVQIFQSICPECGISYVSGGLTKTTTVGKTNPYKDVMTHQAAGNLVDMML